MTKKQELFKTYEELKEKGIDCIVLFIHMPTGETESITNPMVEQKMQYIDKTYNDNLVHSNCSDIYIEDYVFSTKEDEYGFGEAIDFLKQGLKVARRGWNGKGIFIELQVPDEYSKMTHPYIFIDTTGLKTDNEQAPKNRVPWLASQTDMLAEDWYVVD